MLNHAIHRQSAWRISVLLFLGLSCIYIALARGVFVYGDDVLMYQVTESIIEDGAVSVSASPVPGSPIQSSLGKDGKGYAKYGIGQSIVTIPFYLVSDWFIEPLLPLGELEDSGGNQRTGARIWGSSLVSSLAGGATVAMFFLVALELGFRQRTSFVLSLILGFGTLLAHYSTVYMSESLTALCLLTGFYGILRASREISPVSWIIVSGFAIGFVIVTKPAIALACLPFGIWVLWLVWTRWRSSVRETVSVLVAWGLPIAVCLLLIAAYNWRRFGDVTKTGYGGETRAFTTPLLTGLGGLLISPGRGLLLYSLPVVLGIAGLWYLIRRQPGPSLVILSSSIAMLLFYAKFYQWHGGGVWGPRFLVPIIPLLMLPAGEIVERAWRNRSLAFLVVSIAALGVIVSALPVLYRFDLYVEETGGSLEAIRATFWDVSESQIYVHFSRIIGGTTDLDMAAARYDSSHLTWLSILLSVAGLAMIVAAGRVASGTQGERQAVEDHIADHHSPADAC